MPEPTFLYEDSAWMPVPLPWGPNFNSQLRAVMEDPSPAPLSPIPLPDLKSFHIGNTRALQFLDSRQIDSNGRLPPHVCAAAHGTWEQVEEEMLMMSTRLNSNPAATPEFQLLDSYVVSWITLIRINLANLSLIDATTTPHFRTLAHDYLQKQKDMLEAARPFEGSLETALGSPTSPSRLLRNTVLSIWR